MATFTPTSVNYMTSTSGAQAVTSTAVPTSVTLTANQSGRINAGTSVTLSAQATSDTPGSVVFRDNGNAITAAGPVDATGATSTTVTPGAGSHSYTAVFTPTNADDATSTSNAVALSVGSVPTSVTLAASPATTVTLGTSVTLTGTAPAGVAGSVAFFRNGAGFVTVPVSATGVATTVVLPTIGAQSYTAVFSPTDSGTYASSSSAALSVTATQSAPVITAKIITNHPTYGHKSNISVTVTAPGAVPTGVVTVSLFGKEIGFGVLANGSTIFTLPANINPGIKPFVVTYVGDANVTSGSVKLTGTIAKGVTSITIRPATGRLAAGQKLHLTVLLRGDGFTATGKVEVIIGHKVVASGIYRHGYVNIVLPVLKPGSYEYSVKYVGDTTAASTQSKSHGVRVV